MMIGDIHIPDGILVRPYITCSCGEERAAEAFVATVGLSASWQAAHSYDPHLAARHVAGVRLRYSLPACR